MSVLTLVFAVFLPVAAWGSDAYYRWSDGDGTVHFSDVYPPAASAARVESVGSTRILPSGSGLRPGERALLEDADHRRRHESNDRAQRRRQWNAARAKRQRVCARTERQLAALVSVKKDSKKRRRLLRERRALRCFGSR